MSWAGRRRLVILIIIGAVVVAFLSIVLISALYKAPSCSDGVQNQGEAGIDCGGPCALLCSAQEQPPTVLFTKTVTNGEGRIDVVADVENKNSDAAAKNVPYVITLYDANQMLIGQASGMLDLPPNASVPVFAPSVASGNQAVKGAFLDIDPTSLQWFSMPTDTRVVPTIVTAGLGGTISAPRVEATLANPSTAPLTNVQVIVFVHDGAGNIIASSATVVPTIPAQGQATAFFTWNGAFSGVPGPIEAIPVIPLP
jgi:hypothetical protein